jgi:hypothetical protein
MLLNLMWGRWYPKDRRFGVVVILVFQASGLFGIYNVGIE